MKLSAVFIRVVHFASGQKYASKPKTNVSTLNIQPEKCSKRDLSPYAFIKGRTLATKHNPHYTGTAGNLKKQPAVVHVSGLPILFNFCLLLYERRCLAKEYLLHKQCIALAPHEM